jgi:hypothetical protein
MLRILLGLACLIAVGSVLVTIQEPTQWPSIPIMATVVGVLLGAIKLQARAYLALGGPVEEASGSADDSLRG